MSDLTEVPAKLLRTSLREQRNRLSNEQQKHNEEKALLQVQKLLAQKTLQTPLNIGLFLSQDGELGTNKLIEYLWSQTEHKVFLPILAEDNHMFFGEYRPETELQDNRFRIPEPVNETVIGADELDWVFTPLVGFDRRGNRMGMGGGFYDRTFAFKHQQQQSSPYLVGWAHACQEVERLDSQPWDVPLNAIINEKETLWF